MLSLPTRRSFLRFTAAVGLLLSATLTITAASSQSKDLRLVSTVWTPFTNASGQPRFALDLVEAALDRIGVPSVTSFVENTQYTSALTTGPFDGSGATWRDAEREKALIFSQPYLENRLVLIARRGGDVSAQALTAFKGRRLAVVEGYAYGEALDSSGATLVRSQNQEDNLRLLLDSRVDYALMDALVVQYILDHYPEEARTRLQITIYNGWSSVPDRYKVDDLNRPDHTHPTARIFSFSWK